MRRISRLSRAAEAFSAPATPYTCSTCFIKRAAFSTSSPHSAELPFTEKIRQKLWGTDQPPGQADPYGDASVFDRTKERRAREEEKTRTAAPASANFVDATYEPATTWEGLETVGDLSNWMEENWDPENAFRNGFMPANRATEPAEVMAALYQAVQDVKGSEKGERVDETAVKGNPSASEEIVAADRSEVDVLVDGAQLHQTAEYQHEVAAKDPSWLQMSIQDPELKFAVSPTSYVPKPQTCTAQTLTTDDIDYQASHAINRHLHP